MEGQDAMPQNSDRILLEQEMLQTPGLVLFGRSRSRCAQAPLAPHVHPGCVEMVVVRKGCEQYHAEGISYEVRGGEVFLARPDQPHGTGASEQGISEFLWFQLNITEEEEGKRKAFLGLSDENGKLLCSRLSALSCGKWAVDRFAMTLIDQGFTAFLDPASFDRIGAQSLFVAGLERLLRNASPQTGLSPDPRIQAVLHHIDTHLEDSLDMRLLGCVAGISVSSFKRLFLEETGQTPREFVNQKKIDRAKTLLASGADVTETAMALGFSGSDYFSVVFRRHTAMTPSSWQRSVLDTGVRCAAFKNQV